MGECKTPMATTWGMKQEMAFIGLGYLKWTYFGISFAGGAVSAVSNTTNRPLARLTRKYEGNLD